MLFFSEDQFHVSAGCEGVRVFAERRAERLAARLCLPFSVEGEKFFRFGVKPRRLQLKGQIDEHKRGFRSGADAGYAGI